MDKIDPLYGAIPPITTDALQTVAINPPSMWDTMFVTNANNTITTSDLHNIYITDNTGTGGFSTFRGPSNLTCQGDAEIAGKLKVGGVDVGEALEKIEQRLAILRPNLELEERWEKLKELGDKYRQLEAEILGQEEIHRILKD